MLISDIFASKNERHGFAKEVGRFETSGENVAEMLVGMMNTMGMVNPPPASSQSSKGVTFAKKGNVYTVVLSMYNPPIKVSWTGLIRMEDLVKVIDDVAEARKKVGYMNIHQMKNGQKVVQMALAS